MEDVKGCHNCMHAKEGFIFYYCTRVFGGDDRRKASDCCEFYKKREEKEKDMEQFNEWYKKYED